MVKADRFGDRKTWVVRLTDADIPPLTIQVDAETGEVLHSTTIVPSAGGTASMPVEVKYEDYRDRLGLWIPHRVTITNPANGNLIRNVEDVEAEVQLPRGHFRLPLE